MKKKILLVINTLGRAGAEMALTEFMRRIDPARYEAHLYVLTGQGEMIGEVPGHVRVLNDRVDPTPIHSRVGRQHLFRFLLRRVFRNGSLLRNAGYVLRNLWQMLCRGRVQADKLLWRVLSDAADVFDTEYDLAVAYIEGGATYYVADHVRARRKAAIVHIVYDHAGYSSALDGSCYGEMGRIYGVSDEVCAAFSARYPAYADRVQVMHNPLNRDGILRMAEEPGGFPDAYDGVRILTVGRLTAQKALDVSVEAMALLKQRGVKARWYVLGEGDRRTSLEALIRKLGLEQDFVLLGRTDNPYPYMRQCDLYVHASLYEGKSIAVQEAQILGCPVLVSDCAGNREQVTDGVDGVMCALDPQSICDKITEMISDKEARVRCGAAAAQKMRTADDDADKLLQYCD